MKHTKNEYAEIINRYIEEEKPCESTANYLIQNAIDIDLLNEDGLSDRLFSAIIKFDSFSSMTWAKSNLSRLYDWLKLKEAIGYNPIKIDNKFDRQELLKAASAKRQKWFSDEDIDNLLDAVDGIPNSFIIKTYILLFYYGISSMEELYELKVSDIKGDVIENDNFCISIDARIKKYLNIYMKTDCIYSGKRECPFERVKEDGFYKVILSKGSINTSVRNMQVSMSKLRKVMNECIKEDFSWRDLFCSGFLNYIKKEYSDAELSNLLFKKNKRFMSKESVMLDNFYQRYCKRECEIWRFKLELQRYIPLDTDTNEE